MDFLTNRPQSVWLAHNTSSTLIHNTGVPQGHVTCLLIYSLFTHYCKPVHDNNTVIKFEDDTIVIGLNKDNNESAYREEVNRLTEWHNNINLPLNTQKTKELIVVFSRKADTYPPIHINNVAVERVSSFKFLGSKTWDSNCILLNVQLM